MSGQGIAQFIPLILIFVIFYFFLIRPQQKRVKDHKAMVEALKNGKIYSLGIDVYNGEPDIHPEYLSLPNVFVLPHLGSATIGTRTAMGNLAIDNIDEFFKTGSCKNKVN